MDSFTIKTKATQQPVWMAHEFLPACLPQARQHESHFRRDGALSVPFSTSKDCHLLSGSALGLPLPLGFYCIGCYDGYSFDSSDFPQVP